MGLDMYLFKVKKNEEFGDSNFARVCIKLFYLDEVGNENLRQYLNKFSYVILDRGEEKKCLVKKEAYWRKANHLHKWFYEHAVNKDDNDYNPLIIRKQELKNLIKLCEQITELYKQCAGVLTTEEDDLRKLARNSKEKELLELIQEELPRESGFFFGSMRYDMDYFQDTEETIQTLNSILSDFNENEENLIYLADY